ncbi:MAG: glycosyltransferase [Firmicutes bacterium]|nr:glycosyltransferase [Dethiobacter sp.]MCL4462315.1 glycosyltransferase [Bacillota bacterium]MCL5993923.1 glycosyltransferase [Bacillota bacterium]
MKIMAAFLKYDYGIKERGESLEKTAFLPALQQVSGNVIPFWLEDHGYWEDKQKLQNNILEFAAENNPDIIFFILMRDEVTKKTIECLSKNYTTVNWFCDDQWRFENFTRFIAPILTYSITTDKYSLMKYQQLGIKNVILSQWGAGDYVENIDFDNIEYKYDVSFVGGKNPTRAWIIDYLNKKGYRVTCFGNGWHEGSVSYAIIKDIFLRSKISLNLSNSVQSDFRYLLSSWQSVKEYLSSQKRIEQIKARNFEIPCYGGFQVTNYAPGIEDYYTIGKEIAIYTGLEDLAMQIEYYLNNEQERKAICLSGYKRSKDYTFEKRIKKVFEELR